MKARPPTACSASNPPISGEAQLHEHVMQADMMKMQQVPSVEVPAGGDVTFAPMAYHVMLLGLKDRSLLVDGKRFAHDAALREGR